MISSACFIVSPFLLAALRPVGSPNSTSLRLTHVTQISHDELVILSASCLWYPLSPLLYPRFICVHPRLIPPVRQLIHHRRKTRPGDSLTPVSFLAKPE